MLKNNSAYVKCISRTKLLVISETVSFKQFQDGISVQEQQQAIQTIFWSVCNNKLELFLSHLTVQIFTSSSHGTGTGGGREAASCPLCKEQWTVTSRVLQFHTDCQRQLFNSLLRNYAQTLFVLQHLTQTIYTVCVCVCVKMQFLTNFHLLSTYTRPVRFVNAPQSRLHFSLVVQETPK